MDKILVELHIPAAGRTFDIYLPLHLHIGEILPLLEMAAVEMSSGAYSTDGDAVLCKMEDGTCLDVNKRVCDSCLRNGSKLFII